MTLTEPTWLPPADEVSPADALEGRLLSTAALKALPPPTWLIDGLVPLDALTLLYGPSGGGKSFVAVDWALHVATNAWWHGRRVQGGPVLYVVAESPRGVGPRTDAWQQHHQIDPDRHHGVALEFPRFSGHPGCGDSDHAAGALWAALA